MSVGSKHWLLQLSSASGSSSAAVVHGPLSANQVCKLVLGSSTLPSDLSSLASPTLESLAALVESGQQHPWRPVREWDELRKILHVLQDPEAKERRRQRKRKRAGPQTWVYVLGLPDDVSVDEIYEHFKTVGAIRDEPENGKPKIKIYGKGDAAVCFEKELAVQQAMQWLDGSQIRPGVEISVQKAEFQVKDERVDDAEQLRMDKVQKAIKRRLDMKRQKE